MSKYLALGELIRAARVNAGMDQKALAGRLGMGQQAVSAWERGLSRPRHSDLKTVCSVLELDEEAATEAGRYQKEMPDSATRRLALPFERLGDEAFEAFCSELFAFRHPAASVSRNGSTGQKQYGVDVFIDQPASRIGVQCKRHSNFGPKDIRSVIGELKPEAKVDTGVIALGRRTASAGARLEMASHPKWTLLDGEDLSRLVRELPREKALMLVDTYFEGLRKDFLGVDDPSPWLRSAEFDSALAGRLAVERDFELVGRVDELERLGTYAADHVPIVVLVGRGGTGKTRLLRELATLDTGREVRFVRPGPIPPQAFDLLPEGAPIVVIDDATDTDYDIVPLIQAIHRSRPGSTVILAARPRSLPHLRGKLEITADDFADVTIELTDLSLADAETLATEALGEAATAERARRLARAGYDCPFVIVSGAHLLKAGRLTDPDLDSQAALRREIMARFASMVIGAQPDNRTAVLAAVAAVQPAPLDDQHFLDLVATLASETIEGLLSAIDELEDLGLILRRDQTVRVVPDLLGDSILERALVSESGLDKRFAAKIADRATGRALTNALRNVSIIDYQHRRAGDDSDLAAVLWAAVINHALTLTNSERIKLGKGVASVAAIYPSHALDLVDALIAHPAPDEEDEFSRIFGEPGTIATADVTRALAPLIANAAHNTAHLPRGMRLLFEAGRDDSRGENQHPDHSLRLLRELGGYSSRQSTKFYESFIATIHEMLIEEADAKGRLILVEMLKPSLARDIMLTEWWGRSLTLDRRPINFDAVSEVREAAIRVAIERLSDAVPVAMKAIEVLESSLHSNDRNDDVTEEFEGVLASLRDMMIDQTRSPGLRLAAYRALGWHATYGSGERRALARATRRLHVRDDAYLVARQVRTSWDVDEDEDDDSEGVRASARYRRSLHETQGAVDELVARRAAAGESAELLKMVRTVMLDELAAVGRVAPPERLVHRIMSAEPELAADTLTGREPGGVVDDGLARIALTVLMESDSALAESTAKSMLAMGSAEARLVASATISARTPMTGLRERIARLCMESDDPAVHNILLGGGRWFEAQEASLLLDMLHAAPIETSVEVADTAASVLGHGVALPWRTLSEVERSRFFERFAETPKLAPHSLEELLNEEMKLDPFRVLDFLKARVELKGSEDGYEPIPYLDSMDLDFDKSPHFSSLIEDIVEWLLDGDTWSRRYNGEQILGSMLKGFGDEAKALVSRLIASQQEDRIRLARKILDEAPQDFVVSEHAFAVELVELAHRLPDELGKHVIFGLHGSAEYGMRSRSVGVDDPADVALRDDGAALAERYPAGSPVRLFYEDVARRARNRLESERVDDRRLDEPRSW